MFQPSSTLLAIDMSVLNADVISRIHSISKQCRKVTKSILLVLVQVEFSVMNLEGQNVHESVKKR